MIDASDLKQWASYKGYKKQGLSFGQILKNTWHGQVYLKQRWGYGHPTRFKRLIKRISRSRYIPPEEILSLMDWYSRKWDYDISLLSSHALRDNSWAYKGAPEIKGRCRICTMALTTDSDTCDASMCKNIYGWWTYGGGRNMRVPDNLTSETKIDWITNPSARVGEYITMRFLSFLSQHKRYRGRYREQRKKKHGSYKCWSQKCLV